MGRVGWIGVAVVFALYGLAVSGIAYVGVYPSATNLPTGPPVPTLTTTASSGTTSTSSSSTSSSSSTTQSTSCQLDSCMTLTQTTSTTRQRRDLAFVYQIPGEAYPVGELRVSLILLLALALSIVLIIADIANKH